MDGGRFNLRNPAVKRIMQEVKEMQQENSSEWMAQALEDNIFEWHFVIRGPADTEFQGGIYHGRILLPPDYPFKPPSFLMLTPSGRFETNTKICLSISSYHPEHWQPSWSMRTALTALVAFMATPGNGAIGSLDFPAEDRQRLAVASREKRPCFGSAERQVLIQEMHDTMLQRQQAGLCSASAAADAAAVSPAVGEQPEAAAVAPDFGNQRDTQQTADGSALGQEDGAAVPTWPSAASPPPRPDPVSLEAVPGTASQEKPQQQQAPSTTRAVCTAAVEPLDEAPAMSASNHVHEDVHGRPTAQTPPVAADVPSLTNSEALQWEDWGLNLLAAALVVLIAALLVRKVMVAVGVKDAVTESLL